MESTEDIRGLRQKVEGVFETEIRPRSPDFVVFAKGETWIQLSLSYLKLTWFKLSLSDLMLTWIKLSLQKVRLESSLSDLTLTWDLIVFAKAYSNQADLSDLKLTSEFAHSNQADLRNLVEISGLRSGRQSVGGEDNSERETKSRRKFGEFGEE